VSLSAWWQGARYHFVSSSFLAATVGSAVALGLEGRFDAVNHLLVLAALVINHVALNLTDDYFDYRHAVDEADPAWRSVYSGGSGVLTGGLLSPQSVRLAFALGYVLTALIGIALVWRVGPWVLAFLAVGLFSSIFYTAPPVRFGYRGAGEVVMLLNFGPVIGLGTFFVQTGRVTFPALWAALPLGVLIFSLICLNEIPDFAEDRRGGKRNLVARYGQRAGAVLYVAGLAVTYLILAVGVGMRWMPPGCGWAFLTVPLAVRSSRAALRYREAPDRVVFAQIDIVRIHNIVAILLALAYCFAKTGAWGPPGAVPVILGAMTILYLPVAVKMARAGG